MSKTSDAWVRGLPSDLELEAKMLAGHVTAFMGALVPSTIHAM